MFAFAGPAYLVSVGYMDPGNWATDLEGGARFGYRLLWVLVMSNVMAILLQTLSARLGIVRHLDLAQACRVTYPRSMSYVMWFLCEIAIAACDLAEVLGAAIGLNLLFGIPLLAGVLLTAADTLLVLWLTRFGIRIIEAIILALERRFESFSFGRGNITVEKMAEIRAIAEKHGFELAPFFWADKVINKDFIEEIQKTISHV